MTSRHTACTCKLTPSQRSPLHCFDSLLFPDYSHRDNDVQAHWAEHGHHSEPCASGHAYPPLFSRPAANKLSSPGRPCASARSTRPAPAGHRIPQWPCAASGRPQRPPHTTYLSDARPCTVDLDTTCIPQDTHIITLHASRTPPAPPIILRSSYSNNHRQASPRLSRSQARASRRPCLIRAESVQCQLDRYRTNPRVPTAAMRGRYAVYYTNAPPRWWPSDNNIFQKIS